MPKFHCNHCGQRIEVREVYAGHSFACPTCNGQLLVPNAADCVPRTRPREREFSISDFYFSFDGRISVAEYWIKGFLVIFPLGLLALLVDAVIGASGLIYAVFLLASIWTGAALLVKRWHDRNKSGWHYWIIFIPLVGPIWTLVEAGCMEGTKGDNRYGPDPVRRRKRT
jgi:uncharacterized membrane protein YhaH (DUF805 family)/predicted RNA-binding Zn-ribbon protein involved in translation (DUF1610 family)